MLHSLPDDLVLELFQFCNTNANFVIYLIEEIKFPRELLEKRIYWDQIHFDISILAGCYTPERYHWLFIKQFYPQMQRHHQYIANLPIAFFQQTPAMMLNWNEICANRKVNKAWTKEDDIFARLFKDCIDWRSLTKARMCRFSLTFIREWRNYIDWIWISSINDLPASFVQEFMNELNLFVVLQHSNLGNNFIQSNFEQFKQDQKMCKTYEFKQSMFENYLEDPDADLVFDYLFDVQTYIEFDMVRVTDDYLVSFMFLDDDFYGPILNNQQLWLHRGSLLCFNDTDFRTHLQRESVASTILLGFGLIIVLIAFFLLVFFFSVT